MLTLLPSGRRIEDTVIGVDPTGVTVTLSDPVLTTYRIGEETHTVFKRASDFDDTFASQVSDTPEDVDIEIRDQFTLDELLGQFGGKIIPVKFALVETIDKTFVLEFEGESNV